VEESRERVPNNCSSREQTLVFRADETLLLGLPAAARHGVIATPFAVIPSKQEIRDISLSLPVLT